jgi:hypothetical protein
MKGNPIQFDHHPLDCVLFPKQHPEVSAAHGKTPDISIFSIQTQTTGKTKHCSAKAAA